MRIFVFVAVLAPLGIAAYVLWLISPDQNRVFNFILAIAVVTSVLIGSEALRINHREARKRSRHEHEVENQLDAIRNYLTWR